jgi:hypothetical protein
MVISISSTLAGFGALFSFNGTAGPVTAGPAGWPEGTAVERSHTGPTILVFVHPFCSCTGATIEELDRLMASRKSRAPAPVIKVLFTRSDRAWKPGDLWSQAAKLPERLPRGTKTEKKPGYLARARPVWCSFMTQPEIFFSRVELPARAGMRATATVPNS